MLTFQGGIRVPSYTASKSGIGGLTKLLANEWAAKGINVNAIAPGYIATNNTAALQADETRNRAILDRIPGGPLGRRVATSAARRCSSPRRRRTMSRPYPRRRRRLAGALSARSTGEGKMGRFLAFGEVMLRLSPPGRELLMQSPKLDVWVGGAEANVATALARLGQQVGFATVVPDNDLGRAVVATLRGHGVDTGTVSYGGERLGLYFVTTGAGLRATEVLYDRAGSAFAEASAESWDWDALLAGVDRLHLSGITPALGPVPARTAIAAARAASARNIAVSFDGN